MIKHGPAIIQFPNCNLSIINAYWKLSGTVCTAEPTISYKWGVPDGKRIIRYREV